MRQNARHCRIRPYRAALAEICSPLKMNMIYTSRHRKPLAIEKAIRFVSFDELVETSDIISIHCPFNKDSENLFSADVFQKMKNGAVLINTARGKIVDYEALIHYLENGKLYGAGLDVFPDEPHIPTRLKQIDNVVLTPHTVQIPARRGKQLLMQFVM